VATRDQTTSAPDAPRRTWGRALLAAATSASLAVALTAVPPATARDEVPNDPGTTVDGTAPSRDVLDGLVDDAPGSTPRDEAVAACLASDRPAIVAEPLASVPFPDSTLDLPDDITLDARGSLLNNSVLDRQGFGFGVRIRGYHPVGTCLVGGTVQTDLDPESTPWLTWHRVTAMAVQAPGVRVVGTTFRNQGDLMAFLSPAPDWSVIGVRVDGGTTYPGGYAHDDCVENDSMHSGVILDSKFDGCWTFLSATHSSEKELDGGANAVVVQDTLVRLQPYRNSFNVPRYGEGGHSGFFKWARTRSEVMIPPSLTVTDSVFRADDPARYGGNENGFLGLPPGTRCERVLLIGTENWPADELASWVDQCADLRLGTLEDWDRAVAAWDALHPPLRSLAGTGRDAVAGVLGW
jgi:hypothetical protein